MADPHDAGYREALAAFLRHTDLIWAHWVALHADGSYHVPDGGEAYSPMPWETQPTLVLLRPAPRRGVRVQEQWRAELEAWLATPF